MTPTEDAGRHISHEYAIPKETHEIAELAFAGSDGLEKLYIPDSVKEIGNYAFMNCYSLREIRLPECIEHIGAGLFQNCWQLRKVTLPEGTKMIGTDMFENCHGLAEICIPSSVKKVARTALSGCRSLRKIRISPEQIELLPASARYTAVITAMEDSEKSGTDGNDIIDNYVKEHQKSFLDLAINRRSAGAVRYMIDHHLISEDALREYLSKSAATGRTEITALLLDSIKDKTGAGTLDEDPFA